MKILELRDDRLFIGAGVPLSHIARDPLVISHAKALTEACILIGGPQVRNVATLGGNVAHALPAADGTISLMCLNAEADVAGPDGNRRVPIPELFLGPGKSALRDGEIIVGFTISQIQSQQASAFKRIMRPQGVALPIMNLSVWVDRAGDAIAQIRIAVGPGGAVPFRANNAEAFLTGRNLTEEHYSSALKLLVEEVKFRTSKLRATAEYRYHLVGTLLKNTFETAWTRAGKRLR
jgi:CO/xanthine dehydrogenase FAD-binding subunit